jgi:predicted TIM-barrel fold metal-dependent hydrolase
VANKTFREGVAVVGRLGLSYNMSLYHPQINDVADLASAFPKTRIVLNHVGGLLRVAACRGKRNAVFSSWAASIKALAARPNVYVKLGGLGQGYNGFGINEQAEPPSSEMLAATFRPYVETCIEAFGASRSMFEK